MKLKNKQLIGILYLFIILTSCKSEMKNELTEKPFPVVIEEFSQSKFHHSDTTTLTIRKNDSINFHLFGLESDGEYDVKLIDENQIILNSFSENNFLYLSSSNKTTECPLKDNSVVIFLIKFNAPPMTLPK